MCTTNIYTYIYPDGRRETSEQAALCSSARYNKPCSNNVVFQHPHHFVHYTDGASAGASPGSSHLAQFPPTPTYTPRSATPAYRSGDESDRSRRSSTSSHHRRASIYINGQKVINVGGGRHDGPSTRHERILLVDGPPTPRTPPQAFSFPHTAPTSPNIGSGSTSSLYLGSSPRESLSGFTRRPVIVDERPRAERPRIQIAVPVEAAPSPVRGSASSSKRDSQTSLLSSRDGRDGRVEDDSDSRRRARHEREREERRAAETHAREERRVAETKARAEAEEAEEDRQRKMRLRIAKANAEINKRPPVPVPTAPVRASSFSSKMAEMGSPVDKLAEGFKGMTIEQQQKEQQRRREDKARRLSEREQREQREEDEAQRQRLAERMMPRRRATVGPGSRRPRVVYDDGVYRWE